MKRKMWVLVLVLGLFVALPAFVAAQTSVYQVQSGDTGWELARQYYSDATTWQRIVDMNPFLQKPGRVFEQDGKIILLLKPGEELSGLERLNIAPPQAVPIEQLVPAAKVTRAPNTVSTQEASGAGLSQENWLLMLLFGLLIVTILYFMFRDTVNNLVIPSRRRAIQQQREREREMQRDPVTSGPAMVPGGIPPTDTGRLQSFFDEQAVASYARRNPTVDRTTIRAQRIGPIETGTITGEGLVGYLGGQFRPRRITTPLQAYQARYRFPDATEEVLQCLQACMNPVAFGGEVYRGFTFTPATQAVPTPEPVRPAPQPAPHPAIAVRAIRAAADDDARSTLTIGDRVMVFERGVHLTVDEQTSTVSVLGGPFEMTVRPRRIRAPKAKVIAKTGTDDAGK